MALRPLAGVIGGSRGLRRGRMFPNVRLMIVAVLASIMGIVCALGLFAEFRVSHDSFLRETNAGAPLQLGSGGPPATLISAAATFGIRFAAPPPTVSAVATDVAAAPQAADHAIETSPPALAPKQEPKPTVANAPPAVAAPIPTPAPAPEITAAPPPASPPVASDTAAVTATTAPTPANPQPGAPDKVADKSADQPAPVDKPADQSAAKPAENLADRTPAEKAAPERPRSVPELKAAPRSAAAAAKKHVTAHHRPLIARRVLPRPRAVAPAQTFTTAQPFYQWTPAGQTAQPVRRAVARRPRPAPTPRQVPQAAISGTPAGSSPE